MASGRVAAGAILSKYYERGPEMMFVGDFDKIIPLTPSEVQKCIVHLKNTIATGGNHGMSNFEIVLLRTLESIIEKDLYVQLEGL